MGQSTTTILTNDVRNLHLEGDDTVKVRLEVPWSAIASSNAPHGVLMTEEEEADRIRVIAAPVVAAELRRLANQRVDADTLLARAAELDPQPSTIAQTW